MKESNQQFTLPHVPYPFTIEVAPEDIDAQLQLDSERRELARRIVGKGAKDALRVCLSDAQIHEWERTAKGYLSSDGDDGGDFAAMIDDLDAWVNPMNWSALDVDFARDERAVWTADHQNRESRDV